MGLSFQLGIILEQNNCQQYGCLIRSEINSVAYYDKYKLTSLIRKKVFLGKRNKIKPISLRCCDTFSHRYSNIHNTQKSPEKSGLFCVRLNYFQLILEKFAIQASAQATCRRRLVSRVTPTKPKPSAAAAKAGTGTAFPPDIPVQVN